MSPNLAPTPKMRRIFQQLAECWGRPTNVAAFNFAADGSDSLSHLHVAIWEDAEGTATAFNTLGMSERAIPEAEFSAEVHLLVKGRTTQHEQVQVAQFLANLAEFPFRRRTKFDWWERVSYPSGVPLFPTCQDVLFHPAMVDDDPDRLEDETGEVKLLYAIPLTSYESFVFANHGPQAFVEYLKTNDVDPFSRR
jgi:hypothetical protein